ncbi:hypothetical protein EIN_169050 [Entamoeba invadens IP1]|uniref:Uncharacterized protein n=1 Tax=Entamoeba invadens IP1 TaxID=370355 RepID=A0A0A1TY77_ENTIV|nr:hypothetical protein EIN_169050 [Entamoeba invadens IP1]ELP84490.1 hypothetical protein EIN_169050 [Entamoeba invadens IP1]|eukprot:XP_004183836.1 hypothetical protein EIN_169050 [Entamoeba invadens IP1]
MNPQYDYILKNSPPKSNYDESLKGLVMVPFEGGSPIPVRYVLSKENPFNFSLLLFHTAGKDLSELDNSMDMLTKIFRARCITFDYPGYGLNKNDKSVSLETTVDAVLQSMRVKGYRDDRVLLLGHTFGCGPALHYCNVLCERKKATVSTETSGIILLYPTEDVPLGIDLKLDHLFNPTQNVIYFHTLFLFSKGENTFKSNKVIQKLREDDDNYKQRVMTCTHKFTKLDETVSLNRSQALSIIELTHTWFKKLDVAITKYKTLRLNIAMTVTTALKTSKKIPALPTHNLFYMNTFLTKNKMDELVPMFEEKKIYSIVYVVMSNLENSTLAGEDQKILDLLKHACTIFKPFVSRPWTILKKDYLTRPIRICPSTDLLKKVKLSQSTKKLKEGGGNAMEIELEEEQHVKTPCLINFEVPVWAKGVACDFQNVLVRPINFLDFFAMKEMLHKRRTGNTEQI